MTDSIQSAGSFGGDIGQMLETWAQAAPTQRHDVAAQAFSQLNPQQLDQVGGVLLNLFAQHGLSPQAAGVHTTNPQQLSTQDMAKLTTYAQQHSPGLIHQLLSNPIVGMILAAALSYALQRFLGNLGGGVAAPQVTVPQVPAPAPPQDQGGILGGLSGLISNLFGGGQTQAPQTPAPAAPQDPGGGLGGLINDFLGGGQTQAPQSPTPPSYTSPPLAPHAPGTGLHTNPSPGSNPSKGHASDGEDPLDVTRG